jgi:cobalt/nickel transport system permease protein
LHHVVLERWSRGISPLHRRDPRAKLAALIVFLVVLATAQRAPAATAAALFLLPLGALFAAGLPVAAALARAAVVLPFTGLFALASWLAGDPGRGLALVFKSYLSALAVLAVVSTTPINALLRGLEAAGAPPFLLTVAQFLYRYLFVISEEAQHMRKAALSRGGSFGFRGAAGALAVLFARSYERAGEIHRAMLARGFAGSFRTAASLRFGRADALFAAGASLASVLLRVAAERLA